MFLGVPSLPKGAAIEKQAILHTGRYVVRDDEGIEEGLAGEPTFHTGKRLTILLDHANWSVASMQDRDNSLYYEISFMEGPGDACAIICISGSGVFHRSFALHAVAETHLVSGLDLNLERYPRLNRLSTNATSIRLFHLRSMDAAEGEQRVPNIVNFLRSNS